MKPTRFTQTGAHRHAGWSVRTLAAALIALAAAPAGADTLHLKSGKTIQGIVDEKKSDAQKVILLTPSGLVHVPRSKIAKIDSRANMTAEEKRGDMAAYEQDNDKALDFYLKAYVREPNKELESKIADTKARIKERDDKRFGEEFARIDVEVENRKFAVAIALALELAERVKDQPSSRDRCREKASGAYIAQARDYRNTVNYPEAEKAYREAAKLNPAGALPQLELAELIQIYPTRQQEAFDLYKLGLDIAGKDPTLIDKEEMLRYRYDFARIHIGLSEYREAGPLFWSIVEDDPKQKYPKARDYIMQCYDMIRAELFDDNEPNRLAISILKKVIERNPMEDKAHFLVGKIYYLRKDYPNAAPMLAGALKNMGSSEGHSDFADCRFFLAITYRAMDKLPEAAEQLRGLLELQPSRYEAICELGEIYFTLNDYPNALVQFQNGIKVEPGNYRAFLGGARTLRRINKFAEAAIMYEELIKLRNDNADYYFELGLTYAAINRHEDARPVFVRVIELIKDLDRNDPKVKHHHAEVYGYLGLSDVATKRFNEGIEHFDRSLEFEPKLALSIDGKGQAYRELGQLPEAEESFLKAIQVEPGRAEFYLNLGVFYHKNKTNPQAALPYYLKYYEKGGKDQQVKEWIRECGGTPPENAGS